MCVHNGAYVIIEIPYSFTKLFYLSPLEPRGYVIYKLLHVS